MSDPAVCQAMCWVGLEGEEVSPLIHPPPPELSSGGVGARKGPRSPGQGTGQ